jgi:hypothetical protein
VRKLSERTRERKRAAKIVHNHFEGTAEGCYNSKVPHGPSASAVLLRGIPPSESAQCTAKSAVSRCSDRHVRTEWHEGSGQVAQVVERSPEKAGVGGSTPSLATIIPKNLSEARLAFPVRSQSAIFRRNRVRFLATMMAKDLNSNCLSLNPLSVRFCLRRG